VKRALKSLGAAVQKREVVIINRTLDLPVLSLFINFSSSDHNCIAETAYSPQCHVSAGWGQRGRKPCMKLIEREISRNRRIGRRNQMLFHVQAKNSL